MGITPSVWRALLSRIVELGTWLVQVNAQGGQPFLDRSAHRDSCENLVFTQFGWSRHVQVTLAVFHQGRNYQWPARSRATVRTSPHFWQVQTSWLAWYW
jgi:hypothetical protein